MRIVSFNRFRKECHKFYKLWSRFANFVAYRDGDYSAVDMGNGLYLVTLVEQTDEGEKDKGICLTEAKNCFEAIKNVKERGYFREGGDC